MVALSWRHHALIQTLLSRGPLKEDEFHRIFAGITHKNPGSHQQLFDDFLLSINEGLAYVQFELRGCRNQYDGKIYYGVVNNVADEQSKLGTKYSVPQIAYYKAIIEAIVQDASAQGCLSNTEALNVRLENQGSEDSQSHAPAAFKNFSMAQKEKTLNDLVQDQWLCSTLNGNIGLGVRSFLDLRSWFRNNDVPSCEVCNEAGVKADLCSTEGCNVRIHSYCLKKKFSQRRVKRVCPGCDAKWPSYESNNDGVEDEEEEGEANEPNQSQAPSAWAAKRKRTRNCKTEVVDEPGADSTPASTPIPVVGRRTRKSVRIR